MGQANEAPTASTTGKKLFYATQREKALIAELESVIAAKRLPPHTTVAKLLDHVYREGAQVAKLIPDAKMRLHLIEQEQG